MNGYRETVGNRLMKMQTRQIDGWMDGWIDEGRKEGKDGKEYSKGKKE